MTVAKKSVATSKPTSVKAPAAKKSQSQPVLSPKVVSVPAPAKSQPKNVGKPIAPTDLYSLGELLDGTVAAEGASRVQTTPAVTTKKTTTRVRASVRVKQKTPALAATSHANGVALTAKRPGVLAALVEMLEAASSKQPVTKTQILDRLCVLFTDRPRDKMKATVAMQCPAGLRTEKKLILDSVRVGEGETAEKGYWIDAKATAEYRKQA